MPKQEESIFCNIIQEGNIDKNKANVIKTII